jgi:REP element-mobilizing transposase RayT
LPIISKPVGLIPEHSFYLYKNENQIMPQSLSKLFIHIVFSTKHRKAFIDTNIEKSLWGVLGQEINNNGAQVIQVGGFDDHVHILLNLQRTQSISKLIGPVKANSSAWMKHQGEKYNNFYWQDGYAAFSVSPKSINHVISYIQNQRAHHSKLTFKDECLLFFKQYKIEYDEKFCWD